MAAYFFCGIGGSGMLPLAFILQARGDVVSGSDRSRDQGRTPEKFMYLEQSGIPLFAQDGSGVHADLTAVVVSTAVEETIPDVQAARRLGIPVMRRAELLAERFNEAKTRIAIAGTSGKTTTTGMIGYLLREAGYAPTVMNGGIFRNYQKENPYCSALLGKTDIFVTEADESDGSIELYAPDIAILNNISLDHKPMDELKRLFGAFLERATWAVLNLSDPAVAALAAEHRGKAVTYGLNCPEADLNATDLDFTPTGVNARVLVRESGERVHLSLAVPGAHNVLNALAALAVGRILELTPQRGSTVLAGFRGIKRRLEVVGSKGDITVLDDFAHNPDKIAASLATLKAFPGRVLMVFQPHGYAPLRLMRAELVPMLVRLLGKDDMVFMPEPFYAGGTTDRSVGSKEVVADLVASGLSAAAYALRADIKEPLLKAVQPGDRVIIMGARDDTLSDFARDILTAL